MVGDAYFLYRFRTVLTDELLSFDTMIFQELAHGIKVLNWHHIVFRVVEEHQVQIAAWCPSAGERILFEGFLELE